MSRLSQGSLCVWKWLPPPLLVCIRYLQREGKFGERRWLWLRSRLPAVWVHGWVRIHYGLCCGWGLSEMDESAESFVRIKVWFSPRSVVGTKTILAPLDPIVVFCRFVKVDLTQCATSRCRSLRSCRLVFSLQNKHLLFLTVTASPHAQVYL